MQGANITSWVKSPARQVGLVLNIFALMGMAGCAGSPSPLTPTSPNATTIYNLTVVVFLIAAVVFIVVETLLFWSVIRFSRKGGTGEPEQIEGNTKFEIAWTAAPAIVLLIVFFVSLQAMNTLSVSPLNPRSPGNAANAPVLAAGEAVHVHITGHQWWWEIEYPDHKVVTANELHVPVNAVITIDLDSVDVIHSFWVPQLGGKTDVIPGRTNRTWFQPKEVGVFHGQCAEFCGIEHADMRLETVVETPEQFQAWLRQQQTLPAVTSGDSAKGEQVFMTGACIGCHSINGTKAQGKVGPNLTHFASRSTFAGASEPNDTQHLRAWLTDTQKVKPGNLMKIAPLTPEQVEALIAYLQSLK